MQERQHSALHDDRADSLGIVWWLLIGLSLLIVPVFLVLWNASRQARIAGRGIRATAELLNYQIAITNFNAFTGRWPISLGELQTNSSNVVFIVGQGHNDPWSRPYIFVPYHSVTGFGRVMTFGRDGKPGGTGLDADIERRFP